MKLFLLTSVLLLSGSCALAAEGGALGDSPAVAVEKVADGDFIPDDANASSLQAQAGNTSTYLRCYYRKEADAAKPAVSYLWARDPQSSAYYLLKGSWYNRAPWALANMFYTATSYAQLQQVCRSTLARYDVKQPLVFFRAANNVMSFDYTAWSLADARSTDRFDRVVAFGDSLSDNGNIFNASEWRLPNPKTWYQGHFSNGRVWVERLAEGLGLPLYDWAVGGAAADKRLVIPGVRQQVTSWKDYMSRDPAYDPAKTLFTLMIGGNDLVNYGRSVDQIIQAESRALTSLIEAGGRHIMLMNLPDLSRTPQVQWRGKAQSMAAQVLEYNRKQQLMRDELVNKYGPEVDLQIIDVYSVFNQILAHPADYGIDNITQPCLSYPRHSSAADYLKSHPVSAACTNPDRFMFWDSLHPTRQTHQVMAEAALPLALEMLNR